MFSAYEGLRRIVAGQGLTLFEASFIVSVLIAIGVCLVTRKQHT